MKTYRTDFYWLFVVIFASACVIEKEGWDAKEQEDVGHLAPARVFKQKPRASLLKTQGAPCKPKPRTLSAGGCEKGLYCVPTEASAGTGTCLLECGTNVEGVLQKNATRCPSNLRCLRKKGTGLLTMGMFCMEQQNARDKACQAPFDEDACALGLSCLPISPGNNICKEECTAEKACRDSKELCLIPPYARLELQYDKQNKKVSCNADVCEKSPATCACDTSRGFFCRRELGALAGRCARKWGVCGQI